MLLINLGQFFSVSFKRSHLSIWIYVNRKLVINKIKIDKVDNLELLPVASSSASAPSSAVQFICKLTFSWIFSFLTWKMLFVVWINCFISSDFTPFWSTIVKSFGVSGSQIVSINKSSVDLKTCTVTSSPFQNPILVMLSVARYENSCVK